MEEEGRNGMVIVMIGNKVDLPAQREIPTDDGKKFAESKGVYFTEVSAKANIQVTELFAEIGTYKNFRSFDTSTYVPFNYTS